MSTMQEEEEEEEERRPRLDKQHGFLHHITRNQIERRDYHQEKLKVDRSIEL